ncbi:MAG: hypothetical protein WC607_02130 [Candidatus Micrarchaeia archaeon]
MNIVCDSSTLISLGSTGVLDCLEFLTQKTGASFIIPPAVEREIIGHALRIDKYRFSGLRLKSLVRRGVLKVVALPPLTREGHRILDEANNAFKERGRAFQILQEGEAECIALLSFVPAAALAVDEKTTRLLLEDPAGLARVIQADAGERVEADQGALAALAKRRGNTPIIRSTEILAVAVEKGFFDSFGQDKAEALKAGVNALRRAGCSISHRELDEYESL